MAPLWPNLKRELVDRGVTPRRATRVCEELTDHFAELCEERLAEGAAADSAREAAMRRIGDRNDLIVGVLESADALSYARRRPVLSFVAAPPLLALSVFAVAIGCVYGIAFICLQGLGWSPTDFAFRTLAAGLYGVIAFLILPVLAGVFCAHAWHRRCSMGWAFAACVTLACLGGVLMLGYDLTSPGASNEGPIIGLGWEPRLARFGLTLSVFFVFQVLVRNARFASLIGGLRRTEN